jgi:hypothetical protein
MIISNDRITIKKARKFSMAGRVQYINAFGDLMVITSLDADNKTILTRFNMKKGEMKQE